MRAKFVTYGNGKKINTKVLRKWQKRLAEREQLGQTFEQYCERKHFSPKTMKWYKHIVARMEREQIARSTAQPSNVMTLPVPVANSVIRVTVDGVTIEGTDASKIQTIIESLRSARQAG